MSFLTNLTNPAIPSLPVADTELQFRNLLEEASVATAIYRGQDLVIEFANSAMIALWGKGPSVIGKPLREALPELEGQPFFGQLDTVLRTGEPYSATEDRGDLEVNGELQTFYFNFTYKPLRRPDGTIYGILNMAIDVTAQVVAKQRLSESEDQLRGAVEAAEMGYWNLDPRTYQFHCSESTVELFGLPMDAQVDLDVALQAIHADDRQAVKTAIENAISGKGNGTYDIHYRVISMRDGRERTVRAKGKAYFNESGQATRFSGTVQDITVQWAVRLQIEESEARFRLLADFMPQLIWTGGNDGNLTYYNQAVYDYSGLTHEQIRLDGWLHIVHPDDRAENVRQWTESIQTGKPFFFEHRFRRHDGAYRWQLSRALPQYDKEGLISMWIGTSTDIHDQKVMAEELERRVQERTSELQESNEHLLRNIQELEEFAYVSTHDLQEPLRKIRLYSEMVREMEGSKVGAASLRHLERIHESAVRMSNSLKDLLDYSHLSASEKWVPIDLNEVIADVLFDLELLINQKSAVVDCCTLPTIVASSRQMHQLFYNLLNNALKFAREGVAPRIQISAREMVAPAATEEASRSLVELVFTDNGIGFQPTAAERIFIIFQRLHERTKYGGTGIGLALCKKIVQNHRGRIWAKSDGETGASFHVELPIADASGGVDGQA
jgi:PAS domain S-box-containing protein